MNTKKLSQVASIIMGQSPSSSSYNYKKLGFPFFQGKAEFGDIHPTPIKWCSEPKRLAEKNDILISVRAPVGPTNIAKEKCCIGRGLAAIRADVNHAEQKYLYWFLKFLEPYLSEKGQGTTFKAINKDCLESITIPLPPLEEQKRIAAILDKADEIRRKRQEAINLTEELRRSLFLDMFGDPVTNPKGWEVTELSKVCKKITDGTHHSPPIVSQGIPYITAKHLKTSGLDFFSNPWFVSKEEHKKIYTRCNPEKGDVLYIKDGVTTGLAAINNYDFEFSMLSSLALLKVGENLTSEYLCDWLNSENVKKQNLTKLAGAAITRLTLKKIKDFLIPVPPLNLQLKHRQLRQNICKLQINKYNHKDISDNLFKCLLQKAFRGEL